MDFLPTYARAYVFILVALGCASLYFLFIYGQRVVFIKWAFLWVFLTGAAFLSGNIWIFILITAAVWLLILPKQQEKKLDYYFLLLPALPFLDFEIPGPVPGVRLLFEFTYPRMLSLLILLPIFLSILQKSRSQSRHSGNGNLLDGHVDKLVVLYALYLCVLTYRDPTVTSALRGTFLIFIDILIPYYVISRYVRSFNDFQRIFVVILFTGIMLSFIGLLEEALRWKLYNRLPDELNLPSYGVARYDYRGGFLRISATMSHPIPFGYFLTLVLGVLLFLFSRQYKFIDLMTLGLISVALFLTVSRGAWLASAVLVLFYFYLKIPKRHYGLGVAALGVSAGAILAVNLIFSQEGLSIVDEYGTFNYRLNLVEEAIPVIKQNLFFGTANFNKDGALESLRQGQGIIDVVNTYLQVTFNSGMVGLILFLSIFLTQLYQLRKAVNKITKSDGNEVRALGNILIAMAVATLVMLATTSSINFIPVYYWVLIALGSAYVRMIKKHQMQLTAFSTTPQ